MTRRRIRTLLVTTVAVPMCLYLGVIGYFMSREQSLVYAPSHRVREIDATYPGVTSIATLSSDDGTKLVGRTVRLRPATGRWIYLLPSNAGNVTSHQLYWHVISEAGANVFALDYRGYGESDGKPSEQGLYRDALAGYRYLMRDQGVQPSDLVLYGYSLGASVAIDLATKVPVAGVILEGAPTSLPAVGQALYPFLPVRLIARNHFDSIAKIGAIASPKLFLHARNDHLIPFHHAADLYALAKEPKELVELDGDHGTAVKTSRSLVVATLSRFLHQISHDADAAQVTAIAQPTVH